MSTLSIPYDAFLKHLSESLPRFAKNSLNDEQNSCVKSDSEALMIIAGPGSGKTTVLVLRALKLVFCDGMYPEEILITTFTKKAAEEIRSRLIEWGLVFHDSLKKKFIGDAPHSEWLSQIDLNRFVTGTMDSICEEVLSTFSASATFRYSVVEAFVSNGLLRRYGIMPRRAVLKSDDFVAFLNSISGVTDIHNDRDLITNIKPLIDRFIMDRVDVDSFTVSSPHMPQKRELAKMAGDYWAGIKEDFRLDFPLLEFMFLDSLKNRSLTRFTKNIKSVLIDEYQDTNPIQEEIYFTMIGETGAWVTIVGDDDQSLYRFRGATVELFKNFKDRFEKRFEKTVQQSYLIENYRSSPEIVSFFNKYILDLESFQDSRVHPPKPPIKPNRPSNDVPVIGLFRDTPDQLSTDLSKFLGDIFNGPGVVLGHGENQLKIEKDLVGNFGDAVFLGFSVNEYARAAFGNPPRTRLPRMLRSDLEVHGCKVFNPRGRDLRDIPDVQIIVGLIIECIDGEGTIQSTCFLTGDATQYLNAFRAAARTFIATNPAPTEPHTILDFVISWQKMKPQGKRERWPNNLPALELLFKLITWLPFFKTDPEGQVYLEAIARAITQSSGFSSYEGKLVFEGEHHIRSIKAFITDILGAIATNEVDIDEDIMPSIPRNRLPVMTIHQSKGLEFPLVIVDVGSDFKTNHPMQRRSRFPNSGSNVTLLENFLADFSGDVGTARTRRTEVERAFDDLCRLYYVAYSRAKICLVLVGLTGSLSYNTAIQNVALGWDLSGRWSWRKPQTSKKKPGMADNIPLVLI